MIFVCNTGPLIALAKLDRLALLQHLGGTNVCIPPMVYKELWGKIGPEAPLIETALHTVVHVEQPGKIGQHVEIATAHLDDGEREVIVLGTSLQEEVVLVMDDQAGRRVAKELGLPVVGSAGLLLLAKQKGLIAEVLPLLETLRHQDYWLSDAVLDEVRRLAGE
jgi:predicted nucleic acid-binding protein